MAERIKEMAPRKTQRALDLATEKGSSACLQCFPSRIWVLTWIKGNSVMLWNYATTGQWKISPPHVLVGKPLRLITRYDLQTRRFYYSTPQRAKRSQSVRSDVEIKPVLQDISGEHLNRGSNKAQDARLDIHARGFWERHRSAFFDVRVCHPNAGTAEQGEKWEGWQLKIIFSHWKSKKGIKS